MNLRPLPCEGDQDDFGSTWKHQETWHICVISLNNLVIPSVTDVPQISPTFASDGHHLDANFLTITTREFVFVLSQRKIGGYIRRFLGLFVDELFGKSIIGKLLMEVVSC